MSAGIAFHDGRIGDRLVDDGGARDQPVLDPDMDWHVVDEDEAARLGLLMCARDHVFRMDVVVVERDILDDDLAAVRRDAVDEGDHALAPKT